MKALIAATLGAVFKATTHFGKEEIWSYFDRNKQVSCECKLLLITIENYKAKTVNHS